MVAAVFREKVRAEWISREKIEKDRERGRQGGRREGRKRGRSSL